MLLYFVSPAVLQNTAYNSTLKVQSLQVSGCMYGCKWLGKLMSIISIWMFSITRICSSLACSAVKCANAQSTPPQRAAAWVDDARYVVILRAACIGIEVWSLNTEYAQRTVRSQRPAMQMCSINEVCGSMRMCITTSLCWLLLWIRFL
jgi:hypothetical protein